MIKIIFRTILSYLKLRQKNDKESTDSLPHPVGTC